MKKERLRTELNKIPQEFDREDLWNAIDKPKKKSKRPLFWMWFFGTSLILIFGVIMTFPALIRPSITDQTVTSEVESLDNPSNIMRDGVSPHLREKEVKESKETQEEIARLPTKNRIVQNNTKVKNSTPHQKHNLSIEGRKTYAFDAINSTSNLPESTAALSLHQEKDGQTLNSSESTTVENPAPALAIHIPSLPTLSSWLKNEYQFDDSVFDHSIIVSNPQKPMSRFSISWINQFGISKHTFTGGALATKRALEERGLESLSTALIGRSQLGNWHIGAGLSLARYNTHLESSVDRYTVINSLDGPRGARIKEEYSLYNGYQTIDIIADVGYALDLTEKWSLRPTIRMKYGIHMSADGEILDLKDKLIALSTIHQNSNNGKWQGQVAMQLSRDFNGIEVGIEAYLNTQRLLGRHATIMHETRSYGVGIALNKYF